MERPGIFNILFVFFTAFVISPNAIAQRPVEISDSINERNFFPYELTYFIDRNNTLAFADITGQSVDLLWANYQSTL